MLKHVAISAAMLSVALSAAAAQNDAAFVIHRGTNVSHWLSQSTARGEQRQRYFTEKDVEFIASLGFDHIRLPVDPNEITKLDPETARIVKANNGVYSREKLESLLAKPLALSKKLDLPLYCGEWSALSTVPRQARMQWYRDMRANLEKHNIAWANWDYRGGFGFVGRGNQPDQEFIQVLVGQ